MADHRDKLHALLQTIAEVMFPADEEPRKISIDSVDCEGDTPLHVFLWRGDDMTARFLIEHGANVNAIGDMGETPLHVAVRKAAPDTLAALLAAGARTDVVSEFGDTPQQLAAIVGREEIWRTAIIFARDDRSNYLRGSNEA